VSRRPVLALLLSAALLSGCGTGLHSRTYREHGRQDGAIANVGGRSGIAVRNVHLTPPATGSTYGVGSTAFLTGGLVNGSGTADALVGATSDVAGAVTLLVDDTPTTEVAIPAHGAATTTWALALSSLTRPVSVATYVTVTLEFRSAGRVTLQVPVFAGDNGLQNRTPEQNPYSVE
jgi:copper(I)-binding protein